MEKTRIPASDYTSFGSAISQVSRYIEPSRTGEGLCQRNIFAGAAGEITRLEAFCDVVFGFAISLLVVSLEVPHSYSELIADMRGFLPFGTCFAQLVLIWRTHYIFSRRYGLEDSYTVFLNAVLLFPVLFYVYPLKFVFSLLFLELTGAGVPGPFGWHESSVVMRVYAAGFAAVFLLFVLMYVHAYRLREDLGLNPVEVLETRFAMQEKCPPRHHWCGIFFCCFQSPAGSGWLFLTIAPILWIHGSIYGKRTRRLSEKLVSGS